MNTTNGSVRDEADHHYSALGLVRGTVRDMEQVKAAHRRAAKNFHPDTSTAMGDHDLMVAANAAREWFKKKTTEQPGFFTVEALWPRHAHQGRHDRHERQDYQAHPDPADARDGAHTSDETDAHDADDAADAGMGDCHFDGKFKTATTDFITAYLRNRGLMIDARRCVRPINGYKTLPEYTVGEVLRDPDITPDRLLFELVAFHEAKTSPGGVDITSAKIKSEMSWLFEDSACERRAQILERTMAPLSYGETCDANEAWARLAKAAFEEPIPIVVAVLKKVIHQIKSKALRVKIANHLMAVVYSKDQGLGKTEFFSAFLSPLEELFAGITAASALVDQSNVELFGKPVVCLDDMEKIQDKHIETLKGVITAGEVSRRKFFTQSMITFRQQATFVATSNRPITDLVNDPSGHRRFGQITFRSNPIGPARQKIWDVIVSTDWRLLWRSVNHLDPDPIAPYLGMLHAKNMAQTPEGRLRAWVEALDMTRSEIKATICGGPRMRCAGEKTHYVAQLLYTVYRDDAEDGPGRICGIGDFRRVVEECCITGTGPFLRKDKCEKGVSFITIAKGAA